MNTEKTEEQLFAKIENEIKDEGFTIIDKDRKSVV